MKIKTTIIWWGALVLWVGMFTLVGYKNLDPDFGWRLKAGEYTGKYGAPDRDPFSYTMPSYAWIDHAWLTNLVMSKVYDRGGYVLEAVAFGLLAGVLWWIVVPRNKFSYVIVPILFGTGVWISRGGIRPQVLDWIFLAGLLKLLWNGAVWRKWRWLVVPMFGLWANLHGGFAIGPAVLGTVLLIKAREAKKIDKIDIAVWIGGVVATWINPYGPRVWYEVWTTMSDPNLKKSVAEWQPFWVKAEMGEWLLLALSAAILKATSYRLEKWKLGVVAGLILASLSSLRHASLLIVMMVLVTAELIETTAENLKKDKIAWGRAKNFYLIIIAIAGMVFMDEVGITAWRSARNQGGLVYPVQALEFLIEKNYPGQLFSDYGWGGYLIWKYPDKKVFVDGRMPSWRWISPPGESNWAFKDFIKIRDKGDYKEEFGKYHIRTVLWPVTFPTDEGNKTFFSGWLNWIDKKLKIEEPVDFVAKLETDGWIRSYQDSSAVVLISPE